MIKHHGQGYLYKTEFPWAYGSRGIRVHHDRELWWQVAGSRHGGMKAEGSYLKLQAETEKSHWE